MALRPNTVDLAIAGGGLAGTLIALQLKARRPELKILVIDAGDTLGGNHTWSYHETDILHAVRDLVTPLTVHRWPSQQVRFPAFERSLATPYASISSERLAEYAAPRLADSLMLGRKVLSLQAESLILDGGDEIQARAVIDARGAVRSPMLELGFQKFVGMEVRFAAPHGLTEPIIMDATPKQVDGYRFVYVLPFDETRALVEDTRYADGDGLDRETFRREIAAYCLAKGWRIAEVLREEDGVLPIALAGDFAGFLASISPGVALAGMRAGLFHPLTGYSLPDAAALALRIAETRDLSGASLAHLTRTYAADAWRRRGFYRMLSRFLFDAAAPDKRYKVLERFYRMPQPLIERFYAGVSTMPDQARVLTGKPPVPIMRAVRCLDEAGWRRAKTIGKRAYG